MRLKHCYQKNMKKGLDLDLNTQILKKYLRLKKKVSQLK